MNNDVLSTLSSKITESRITMLGVGPMSKTVTDAAIDLANLYSFPLALIPSRRQVDAANLGGGYVENWSTEVFSNYVLARDKGGYCYLSRDHSGPWQGGGSALHSTLESEMLEVKASLESDILSGFKLIHIDPSPALARGMSAESVEDLAVELIDHCVEVAQSTERIAFEVGTDEQDMAPDSILETEERLHSLLRKIRKAGLPKPLFYVVQTGTKVAETRNIGSFDQPFTMKGALPSTVHVPKVLNVCSSAGLLLKEHNADYLSDRSLAWHRKFGIHAANVAPEFGVTETRSFLECMHHLNMDQEVDKFAERVITGGKWQKWMLPNSKADVMEKVEIAGHYHFADEEIREIRTKVRLEARKQGWDSESRIRTAVTESIRRYLQAFGYGNKHD